MYIEGRLRTGSRPSSNWKSAAVYFSEAIAGMSSSLFSDHVKDIIDGDAPAADSRFRIGSLPALESHGGRWIGRGVAIDRFRNGINIPDDNSAGGEVVRPLGCHISLGSISRVVLAANFNSECR